MRRLTLVLLLLFTVSSLGLTISKETPTLLNVENTPPHIIQNFSDIHLLAGVPAVNYLDLDDYFVDDNGDTLNITYETTLTNVTITINSENEVSFYPDPGYIGVGQLRFTVADASANVTGNWFTVTIGEDNQAPRWSNPQKNKVKIYQNNIVNFSSTWTDNMGLHNFIFSIDQGTGWVNASAISFSGLINQSLFSTIISAPPGTTVSWRFYAQDIYGNVNATPVKEFTVTPFDYNNQNNDNNNENTLAKDLASILASQNAVSTEAKASNFKVDPNNIKLSMRQGDEVSKTIKITNTGQKTIDFTADISSLSNFAILSDTGFSLGPGETKELVIDFKAPDRIMPDQYFGFLRIEADETVDIPIILDIRAFESKISVNVFIPEKYKTTRAGKAAKAVVTITSTKDLREANLSVFYAIKNFKGDILQSKTSNVKLFSSFEDVFNLTVPQETKDGEYLFYVRATGGNLIDIGSDTFFVGARFRILRILQRLFYPLLFLIIASVIIILIMIYKRNKDRQKALELYIMLNEIRGLIKQGKMEGAIEMYKRIKVAYGQHISSDFQKDKDKIKAELNKFAGLLNQNPIVENKAPVSKPANKPTSTPQPKKGVALLATKPTSQPSVKPAKQISTKIVPRTIAKPITNTKRVTPAIKNIIKKILPINSTSHPTPAKPVSRTIAKPIQQAPAKPVSRTPAKPVSRTPAKPTSQTVTKPTSHVPAKLASAKPAPQAPAKPTQPSTQQPITKKEEAKNDTKKI